MCLLRLKKRLFHLEKRLFHLKMALLVEKKRHLVFNVSLLLDSERLSRGETRLLVDAKRRSLRCTVRLLSLLVLPPLARPRRRARFVVPSHWGSRTVRGRVHRRDSGMLVGVAPLTPLIGNGAHKPSEGGRFVGHPPRTPATARLTEEHVTRLHSLSR
jgi:hypothetical protein